jgi:hypothetical protein
MLCVSHPQILDPEHKMTKQKKRPRQRRSRSQTLSREEFSITREAEYIVKRAQNEDSRIVKVSDLILFSTSTGDAWILDSQDGLALCLVRGGERQPFTIAETPATFSIEWTGDYRIEGDAFIVAERSGRIRTIFGYPTSEMLRATLLKTNQSPTNRLTK